MASERSVIRVAVVIDSLSQGGAEQSLMALLPHLRAQDIDAELVLIRSISPDREAAMAATGVRVRVVGPARNLPDLVRRLRSLVREERPDLLHVTLFDPIVAGALAAIGTGVPVLASQASTPPQTGRGALVDTPGRPWKVRLAVAIEAFVLRRLVTRVHAVSPGVRTAVAEQYHVAPERITVAERGRDASRFRPPTPAERDAARSDLGMAADDEVVVALGRHEPSKGFEDLVAATAALVASRPRLHVLLAGREGNSTDQLRAAIDRAGVVDRIHLLGDRSDVERILHAGDVFVLSSLREGTSGATIEAMATGLPVVATELPGLAGILVGGRQALLVPPADPGRLAEAIARVLDDRALAAALGAAGLATFRDRFTIERSVQGMCRLYRFAAAEGSRRGRLGRRRRLRR
jgi:glycosyltransferase involved in cell wall biosynthesis